MARDKIFIQHKKEKIIIQIFDPIVEMSWYFSTEINFENIRVQFDFLAAMSCLSQSEKRNNLS